MSSWPGWAPQRSRSPASATTPTSKARKPRSPSSTPVDDPGPGGTPRRADRAAWSGRPGPVHSRHPGEVDAGHAAYLDEDHEDVPAHPAAGYGPRRLPVDNQLSHRPRVPAETAGAACAGHVGAEHVD